MAAAKSKERQMAIQLRSGGLSLKEICERLGVSKSSVSVWVSHIKLSKTQKKAMLARLAPKVHAGRKAACDANKKKYDSARLAARRRGFEEADGRPLHVTGCMLYWAEGSKGMNAAVLTNTDPLLLKKFIEFLVMLGVPREKITFSCRVHKTPGNMRPAACRRFWSSNLGLSPDDIKVFDANDNRGVYTRKSRYPHGVGRIQVYDYSIVQRIYGAIERYVGEEMVFGRI